MSRFGTHPSMHGKHLLLRTLLVGLCGTIFSFLLVCSLSVEANPPQLGTGQTPAAQRAASPLDVPLRLIADARQAFQGVQDYTCLFIKRERLRGQMQPDNMIEMRVRNQPFSVYLRWLSPQSSAGQEVCYVAGKNNGNMRVHSNGLAGVVGFISMDPRDPRAMQNSRHAITEAGLGNLIDRFSQRWDMERQVNKTQVRVGQYNYNQRPCSRVETIHPDNSGREFYSYRTAVYFDNGTHLPVRVETYDWPRQGEAQEGSLLEVYSYVQLRINVGLNDRNFSY